MSSRRGGVSSGVKGLVASVKKHKKFRQLASYSVQCLKQVITPPAIGWERNLKDAFENKAANAVLDVLKLHPADEAVQEASIACLSGFASNPKYASDLVDRNVVGVMCASLDSMSGKSGKASKQLDDTIQLLMSISQRAPEGLLKTRKSLRKNVKEETTGIGEVLHIMQAFKETRPDVVLGMARVVERLTKTATGAQAVMDAGGVEIMLETLEDELYEDRADVAQSMFRSFERMSKDTTGADRLRGEFSALDRIARVSESFQANERVSKIGGRVLTKLASGNVSELLREMQNPSTPKEKQEFLALLLSNLATEEDNVERIVKEGGVSALQTMLGSGIAKASAGAARAIGRIAESQSSFLEQDGADATLRQMLKTLTDNAAEADTAFAVTDALSRMATGPDAVRRLAMARAYHRALAVLKEYPEHEDHSLAAMQLLETAAVFDYDLDALTGDGIIEAVCVAMNGHDDNVAIQLAATQLLIYLASSQRNLSAMVRADVIPHLMRTIAMTPERLATSKIRAQAGAGSGGGAAAGGEEEDEDENSASAQFLSSKQGKKAVATARKTIETTLYLLASVFLDPRNVSRLSDEDESGLLKLLPAVSRLSNEASMRETARELLEAVSTDEEVMRLLADLEGTVDRAVEGASAEDSRAAAEAVSCLSALMVLPHNAERIATEDNLKVLSAATTKVAQASKLPKQATLLNGLCQVAGSTFHALAEENPVVWGMMKSSGVVRSVVQAVKLHPKKKKLVRSSMRVIEDMARLDANEIARSGGVEAAARALRVNASSGAVVLNASNTLLQISATDAGAVAIARDGGSRQVIETINANLSTPAFERPMEAMLSVMQRVAMTTEGAEALRQQDGVSTIIDAAEALSASGSSVAQATTKVLSKLVVDTDVNAYLQDLTSLGTAAKEKGKTKADKMRPVLARIGHVSSVGSNAAKIAKGGGDRQLADVTRSVMDRLKKAETAPKGSESDAKKEKRAKEAVECQEMLPMAIKAVANVASAIGSTDAIVSAVTDVSETLQRGLAVKECFDAITAIAASDVKGAQAVQGSLGGKVAGTMVEQLKILQQDEVATRAGFAALGSLASSGAEGRKQVAATEAGAMAAEWLEENMEDGAPQAVASALGVLGGLCSGPEGAESAKKVGAVDAAKSALSKICMEEANPEVLRSAVGVLAGLAAQGPQEAKALSDAGAFRRVMRAVAQHQEYLQDSGCATDVMNLVSLACQDADAAEDVNQAGAMGFIFASMNASGTDKGVIAAAQNALRAFGAKRDAGELTSKLAQACKALEELDEIGGQKMRDSVDEALAALEEVGNYMVVDGVVTKANAATFLETVSNAVGLVAESELATPDQISQGLRSMSRLAALAEPGSINLKDAVEVTLDALALYEDQAVVAEAAAECMGQMAQDSSAVDAMVELNVVTELSRMGRKHAGSQRLQDAVASCVDTVTKSTQKDIKKLAASASGSEFLTGLLAANATDASQAQSIVSQIAAVDGGEHALFSALQKQMAAGSGAGGPPAPPASGAGGPPRPPGSGGGSQQQGGGDSQMSIVSLEALKALATKAITKGTRYAADAGRAGALAQVLQSAISTRSKLKETSTEAEQIDAIERNRNAVVLLAASQLQDARAAGAFVANKGLENLLQLLEVDVDDAEVAPLLLKSIEQVVRHRDAKVIDSLANEEDTWMIASSVSVHPEVREVALHVARILKHVAEVKGHNESNINRHCFQQLQAIEARWRADAEVSAEARAALKVMDLKFSSKAQAKVMAAVQSAGASLAQFATAVQGGGHVDQAQVAAISQNLEQVAQSVQGQSEENMAKVDQPQLASMVQVLSHQKESAEVATRTAKVLSALSSNEENCGEIARSGGVEAIIDAVKSQPDNLDLVRALVDMLERISRSMEFRQSIVDMGAVPVLVGLCQGPCVKDPTVAEKILATIANLVFESRKNVNLVVDSDGVSAVEGCMQAHQRNTKVLENAMNALSSLTWESPHNKLVIGNTCGDEIAQVLRDFPGEKDLVQMALRALGNVSAEDAVVGFVVYEHEAVRKIVEAVDANMKDEETVALAFEVLGNFAQATQCEVKDDMSVQQYIHFDAASEKALDVMRSKPYSAPIQTACMFFLTALLADETVATDLQETDIVELLVRAMKAHDWDAELLAQAAEMLTYLPPKPSVEQFLALNGMRLLVQSLETLSTEIEVVTGMCRALCVLGKYQNQAVPMAYLPEVHLSFTSLDVPRSLLAVLETNMSSAPAVQAVAAALGSMAVEDDAAKSIAEQGMHIICEAMTRHKEDGGVTFYILRLIKLLCLVRENISLLIQADGITRLTDLFMIYDGDIMIILEAVVTLSTVATSDTEFADVMKNIEGADVLLRDVMTEYEEPAKASEDDPVLEEYTSEDPVVALEALKGDKLCLDDLQDLLEEVLVESVGAKREDLAKKFDRAVQQENRKGMETIEEQDVKWQAVQDEFGPALERGKARQKIVRDSKSALSMMDALVGMSASAATTAKAARKAQLGKRNVHVEDALGQHRHTLTAGKIMFVWMRGRKIKYQVLVTDDLQSIVWQMADSSHSKMGSIPVSSVTGIKDGLDGKNHTAASQADLSFFLESPAGPVLALETINKGHKRGMMAAFQALLEHRDQALAD